ncbi:MAG: sigma-70 family RNA polymerase sigma factor [Eubacteriales bacterium]|nr:sigma-70 family RNA polymerase sigma factor [Eubacteriales bacterium]
MIQINLRDYYPIYPNDMFVEVTEEVAEQLHQWEQNEKSHRRKLNRYRAHYSLDIGDGIENDAIFSCTTPDEVYERKLTRQQLHEAISALPDKQAKRVYAHFIMGMSQADIARAERISTVAVNSSIVRGLQRMGRYLKQNF